MSLEPARRLSASSTPIRACGRRSSLLDAIRDRQGRRRDLLQNQHLQRGPDPRRDRRLQNARKSSPVRAPLLMMTDRRAARYGVCRARPELSEKLIGEGPSRSLWTRSVGHRRRAEPPQRRGCGQPGAGTRRIQDAGRLRRRVPSLVLQRPRGGRPARGRVHRRPAARRRAGDREALPRPGGATASDQNTDEGPVTVDTSLTSLRNVDETPYRSAIAAGVKLVMSSWAVYPALDPRRPAGLSRTVIETELRGRLGFRGVTITDSLAAGALRSYGSLPRRGLMAARAVPTCCWSAAARPTRGSRPTGAHEGTASRTAQPGIGACLSGARARAAGSDRVARIAATPVAPGRRRGGPRARCPRPATRGGRSRR